MEFMEYRSSPPITAPFVTNFVDYREYLKAWYEYQKSKNTGFSYAVWAMQAGFKSRSFLRLVMLNKRALGADSIPLVIRSLKLQGTDAEYFSHLVHYAHATKFESRDYYFQQILRLGKASPSVVKDSYRFLAHPKTPRAHLLISLQQLDLTTKQIADTLDTSLGDMEEILENLQRCELATYDPNKKTWRGQHRDLTLADDLGNLALQSFHNISLKEAQEAIQWPRQTRHFGSLLLTLTPNEYEKLKKELDQFCNYLARKFDSSHFQNSKIYQFNFNFIPASRELIRSEKSPDAVKDPKAAETNNGVGNPE